jgi:predicted N-acyltransferase
MPDGRESITLKVVGDIADVEAAQWDACAGTANPFVSHAFLLALEESRSVGRQAGWLPYHLIAQDAAGALVGAVPAYVKSHSQGEYVFDHGWAQAYEEAGGRYYPKLQVAVPFTPVPGPRLLVRPGSEAGVVRQTLIAGLVTVAERSGVSSLHVTFPDETDAAALRESGLLMRAAYQFHWANRGYTCFDDFLAELSSRKRKAIRKEREGVRAQGLQVHALTGGAIEARHWDAFHRCYMATGNSKWGRPYLTRDFFHRLGAAMADRVLLVMAEDDGQLVAGALNLIGSDALYGRNWGCLGEYPYLHFEACYYQAIDFAIARGLARVEAGAQGEHKIQRGYLPVHTWSAHWIENESFAAAVADFLKRERRAVDREIEALAEFSPFRKCEA